MAFKLGIDFKDAGIVLAGGAIGGVIDAELKKYADKNPDNFLAKYQWLGPVLVAVGGMFLAGYGKKKGQVMMEDLGYGLLAAAGADIADYFFSKYETK